jgi:hypothetical protein
VWREGSAGAAESTTSASAADVSMHEPRSRSALSFIDRTASSAVPPRGEDHHAGAGSGELPAGLFSQPSQPSQATQQPDPRGTSGRQPLDLRKTAAITVAIANVQIRDDEMTSTSQEAAAAAAAAAQAAAAAGPCSSRPPGGLQRNCSINSRPGLTIEVASRMPSQDMW